jgi:hypothetical protein
MENLDQRDGATVDRHGDTTKVESSTIIIKARRLKKSAIDRKRGLSNPDG